MRCTIARMHWYGHMHRLRSFNEKHLTAIHTQEREGRREKERERYMPRLQWEIYYRRHWSLYFTISANFPCFDVLSFLFFSFFISHRHGHWLNVQLYIVFGLRRLENWDNGAFCNHRYRMLYFGSDVVWSTAICVVWYVFRTSKFRITLIRTEQCLRHQYAICTLYIATH